MGKFINWPYCFYLHTTTITITNNYLLPINARSGRLLSINTKIFPVLLHFNQSECLNQSSNNNKKTYFNKEKVKHNYINPETIKINNYG